MQEKFYLTNSVTQRVSLPQPFDNHHKEFLNTKEVKVEKKDDD